MAIATTENTEIKIGLRDQERQGVAELLKAALADEYVLYTKTRNYHWNVVGPRFHDLHLFFEKHYDQIDLRIDEVAERMRAIGAMSPGSMAEFMRDARLKEEPAGSRPSAEQMLQNLLDDHESLIRSLRQSIDKAQDEYHDMGTTDFLTGLMEEHEKMAWMIRAMIA